jgi:hypothetical protein
MLQSLRLDPKIEKRLEVLRRSGRKAALAADKAEKIITRLKTGGVFPDQVGSVTKHGELRIKGVMKYDLGSGYRLITFRHDLSLYMLYVGSHDECHRWIENNRELTVDQVRERCAELPVIDNGNAIQGEQVADLSEEEDFDPLAEISENDLRRIFCGLVDQTT